MITVDNKPLLEDLKKLQADMTSRMENMVRRFSQDIVEVAVSKTPIGDISSEQKIRQYLAREKRIGLDPTPGFAKGSWQVSFSTQIFQKAIYSAQIATDNSLIALKNYKLGNLVYIGNTGPYIADLENNWSPQTEGLGILKPTVQAIEAIYRSDLVRYYQE